MKNVITISIFIGFILISPFLISQNIYQDSYILMDKSNIEIDENLLNFTSALDVNKYKNEIENLKTGLNNVSVFLVYKSPLQANDLMNISQKNLKISEDKIAGFEEVNLPMGSFPKLISYKESIKYGNNDMQKLMLNYDNNIYESVIFPYSISKYKKEIIETYLALKFSIPLKSNYISSKRDTIYNLEGNEVFISNIFGLGRDDGSHLYQRQSSDLSNILQIGIEEIASTNVKNKSEIKDDNFFIIADNGEESGYNDLENLDLQVSKKNWKGKFVGSDLKNKTYQVKVDAIKLFNQEKVDGNKNYWMVISDKKQKKIDYMNAAFIQGNYNSNEEPYILFNSMKFNDIQDDEFLFSMVSSNDEFIVLHEVNKVDCYQSGSLSVKIIGNASSYKIDLVDKDGHNIEQKQGKEFNFNNLQEGLYFLEVLDEDSGEFIRKEILINSSNNNDSEIIEFSLNESQDSINAYDYVDENYSSIWWEYNGKIISNSAQFTPLKEGKYILFGKNSEGCLVSVEIEVKESIEFIVSTENIQKLQLFPNPVKAGEEFYIKMNLPQTTDLVMSIYTVDGALISKKNYFQKRNIIIKDRLYKTGIYTIIVESYDKIYSYKLIVN